MSKRVIETKYGKTKLRCINMPATGDTLVVAPNYKKTYAYVIIENKMIAEEIAADKTLRAEVFIELKKYHAETRSFLENIN